MREKSRNKGKHEVSVSARKRWIRAFLTVATALLTAGMAGCSKEPSEPEQTPTATVSSDVALTPGEDSSNTAVKISEAEVGDTVIFGSYEQDNDQKNGPEAIEWIVLDKKDGQLLLLSKYALDCRPYNEKLYATWEKCSLRSWLNSEFYETAFNQTEQEQIATTKVKNEDNPERGTEGGNDTEDKVFLLSIGEVLEYFDPDYSVEDPARCAKITEYAKAQGGTAYSGDAWWWLRSPGIHSGAAACVYSDGDVNCNGVSVDSTSPVARPALWINPES